MLSITYEKMEEQQKGVVSIKSDMVLNNYSLRIRTPEEDRRLRQVKIRRTLELKDKVAALEAKLLDVLAAEEFSEMCELYFMNRNAGTPVYDEDLS